MLIALTRSTNPISSFFLIFVFWLVNLVLSFREVFFDYSNDSYFIFYKFLLAQLSILGTSVLLNKIIQKNKIVGVGDVFSGVLFLMFMIGFQNIHQYYRELMSLFLITLSNNSLICLYNVKKNYLKEFKVGILYGLSILITPYLISMPILVMIGISLVLPFTWRDLLIPFLGCLWVLLFIYSLLFVLNIDSFNPLFELYFSIPEINLAPDLDNILILLLLLFELVLFFRIFSNLEKRSIKDRVFYWLWIWTLFFLIISFIFFNECFEKYFLILSLCLPCSLFGTEFFPKKRKLMGYWRKECLIYLLILAQLSLRIY